MAAKIARRVLRPVLAAIEQQSDLMVLEQNQRRRAARPNPLNKFGRKIFSQTDEDGITLEIIRRLRLPTGVYAEFGVGNGLENNTLLLAALGWRGFWVGCENLAAPPPSNSKFTYIKRWVTLENISQLIRDGLNHFAANDVDIMSLDLDGNDIYLVDKILSDGVRPKLFIVEYNAKFAPPIEFKIDYDPQHTWKQDDYFGASIASFAKLFGTFGYQLVCCNSDSGANAFFIRSDFSDRFSDVPVDINDIYIECRYYKFSYGQHPPSAEVLRVILNQTVQGGEKTSSEP